MSNPEYEVSIANEPAILAESECLTVSATLEGSRLPRPRELEMALEDWRRGESVSLVASRLGYPYNILFYTVMYGGLILSYKCNPVTPISRVHVSTMIAVEEGGEARMLSDSDILRAWSLVFHGEEAEGLNLLAGPLIWPSGYKWGVGGPTRISPWGLGYPQKRAGT